MKMQLALGRDGDAYVASLNLLRPRWRGSGCLARVSLSVVIIVRELQQQAPVEQGDRLVRVGDLIVGGESPCVRDCTRHTGEVTAGLRHKWLT